MRAFAVVLLTAWAIGGCGGQSPAGTREPTREPPRPASVPREGPGVHVPDVRGERVAAGRRAVERAGASVTLDPESDDASNCVVADQEVIGQATPEESVTLTVTCAPPDVTGDDGDSAGTNLEREGFEVSFDPDLSEADPTGCTVQSQAPSQHARPGSVVVLRVACQLPDVRKQDGAVAQRALEEAGFTVRFKPARPDPSDCTVKDQAPAGNALPGTEVTLALDCPGAPWY
jgi:beta-lactam-binding protein with PASTA domain